MVTGGRVHGLPHWGGQQQLPVVETSNCVNSNSNVSTTTPFDTPDGDAVP